MLFLKIKNKVYVLNRIILIYICENNRGNKISDEGLFQFNQEFVDLNKL